MKPLHRLQQRLSLTKYEAMALSCLSGLLIIGIIARQVQQRAILATPDSYAELDQLFFERSGEDRGAAAKAATSTHAAARGPNDDERARAADGPTASTRPPAREPPDAAPASGDSETLRIDINRASGPDLEKLPRIGPKTAERILAFREAYGPFRTVDDLQQVKGIGPKTLERLRPRIYAGPPPSPADSSSSDSSDG